MYARSKPIHADSADPVVQRTFFGSTRVRSADAESFTGWTGSIDGGPSTDQRLRADGRRPSEGKGNGRRSGLPDRLRSGVEQLSGFSMADVRVHYDSPAPARMGAVATTQGPEIHLAPGATAAGYLPHEAWHVVQQAAGRVQQIMTVNGVGVNENPDLEREATVMGTRAAHQPHDNWHTVRDMLVKVPPAVRAKGVSRANEEGEGHGADELGSAALRRQLDAPFEGPPGLRFNEVVSWGASDTFGSIGRSGERKVRTPTEKIKQNTTTVQPVIQRLEIKQGHKYRATVRSALVQEGYKAHLDSLVAGIGAQTIVEDVGVDALIGMIRKYNDIDLIIRTLNNASAADVAHFTANAYSPGTKGMFQEMGDLRLPTDQEVDRYYNNYLRVEDPRYNVDAFTNFKNDMRANSGQYWDFSAHGFQRLSEAFRDAYAHAPVQGTNFSTDIYSGSNLDFATHATAQVPNWDYNFDHAIGRELEAILAPLAVPNNYGRTFNRAYRAAVAHVQGSPQAAQEIINRGGQIAGRLNTLMDALSITAIPSQMLAVLAMVLNPAVGAAHDPGFLTALNHINELAAAQPRLMPAMVTGMPFGNRADGLRGHFIKHPLGIDDLAYIRNATWEAQQWMGILNLAPNGLITRSNVPNIPRYSVTEWRIFAQHAYGYRRYYWWNYTIVNNDSQPVNNNERDALIGYLQTATPALIAPAGPDGTSIATAHENVYQDYVSNRFDGAGDRFLYWDNGVLKINAMAGNLFMVAAWNGAGTFDLSTGFLIDGGAGLQYDLGLPTKIMNV